MRDVDIARTAIILATAGLAAASSVTFSATQSAQPGTVLVEMAVVESPPPGFILDPAIKWVAFTEGERR